MRNSKEYTLEMIDFLSNQNVKRILLPDTLVLLSPSETFEYINEITSKYPNTHFNIRHR